MAAASISRPAVGFFILLSILIFGASCSTTKYLQGDERFLKKNKIVLRHAQQVRDKTQLKYRLNTVLALKPNRKWLIITRRWFYYRYRDTADATKFRKWVFREIAEPPAILDTALVNKSVENIKTFMAQQGFFNARVEYSIRRALFKKAVVKYIIYPGEVTTIDSIFLVCPDARVKDILLDANDQSRLKPGAVLSQKNYTDEVNRTVRLLRSKGFAKFNPGYIPPLAVDTSGHKTRVRFEVLLYQDSLPHPVFNIGEVHVLQTNSFSPNFQTQEDTVIGDIRFLPKGRFRVKPSAIYPKIAVRPGEQYNINHIEETQRLLNRLTYFRTININQVEPKKDTSIIDLNILMLPRKKMSIEYLIDLNNSNVGSTGQSGTFIGVNGNINFEHRNIFRGSELLQINVNAGLDFALRKFAINSSNFTYSGNLFFPKYINTIPYVNPGKWFKNSDLYDFANDLRKYSQSHISTTLSIINIPNWYRYQLFKAGMGINYYGANGSKFIINNVGIEYFNPAPEEDFKRLLDEFIYLKRSFKKQLFTGFIFKGIDYNSPSHVSPKQVISQWAGSFEVSGLEVFAANKLYNAFAKTGREFKLRDIDYSKYAKLELSGSLKKNFSENQVIGGALRLGVALPLNKGGQVPYVSQFFAGGPNSIRGWSIRELGPGGYIDSIAGAPDYRKPYYQSGDLKMEFISEWRFKLYWILNGAIFLDAGNVWTLRPDADRPGAVISSDFYKQIAVGSGFGLRLDLTYFILRFDLGLKMRNPFPDEDGNYWINYGGGFRKLSLNDFNYNIQIGYPF